MKKTQAALAGIIAALAASCVTSGDLARVEQAQAAFHSQQAANLEALRADSITPEEYEDRSDEAFDELRDEIGATIEAVEERTAAVATAAKNIPTDPSSLITYLLGIGGTIAGSVAATNKVRDNRRKIRNEQV